MSDCGGPGAGTGGITARPFGADTEADALGLVNAYIAGWPYSRPVDHALAAHWRSLADAYQPEHMLVAYRDGTPQAFLHGERAGNTHYIHLLAMPAAAVDDAVWLLHTIEERAREARVRRLCGPTCVSGKFYGGYLLGLEPYHPHWAVAGTEVYVRSGFHISQSDVLLVADLSRPALPATAPPGYEVVDTPSASEFGARAFRLAAVFRGKQVAFCGGRLYPDLAGPAGGPLGQIGPVGTDPEHRRRGLATALSRLSLGRLQEWGAAEALVSTGLENTPALRAYERAGFERRHSLSEWSKLLD